MRWKTHVTKQSDVVLARSMGEQFARHGAALLATCSGDSTAYATHRHRETQRETERKAIQDIKTLTRVGT
eukprot:COSAG03_NODE_11035_length_615_cov_1.001938_1_plen_69_part_10